ncbi:hypothetical protein BT69DRAFT_1335629 [Atractiella rhizophila]|nr:hypothetical protein BT69DRAFT_1335629 [Atractiella rhizophila]
MPRKPTPSTSAAAHLLRQAASEPPPPRPSAQSQALLARATETPWTGDEPVQDAVLRMLVDKYKPLRVTGWEKKVQQPTERPIYDAWTSESSVNGSASTKVEPGKPVNPWDVTFKPPETHVERPKVKSGSLFLKKSSKRTSHVDRLIDVRERVTDRRLSPAASSSSLGSGENVTTTTHMPLPRSLSSIRSLIDERIEHARQRGAFNNLNGRGKPLQRDESAYNPFLSNEERILNRIVGKQGAVPPWIELQKSMEAEVARLRSQWKENWTRRAVRSLGLEGKKAATGFRDQEWEKRERTYHELDLKTVNSSIRSYNAAAPYHVRRSLLSLESELERVYKESEPEIEQRLVERNWNKLPDIQEDLEGKPMEGKAEKELETEWKWSWGLIGLGKWMRERWRELGKGTV